MFQDGSVGLASILTFRKKRALRTHSIKQVADQIENKLSKGETQDINLLPIEMYPAETVHHLPEIKDFQTVAEYT